MPTPYLAPTYFAPDYFTPAYYGVLVTPSGPPPPPPPVSPEEPAPVRAVTANTQGLPAAVRRPGEATAFALAVSGPGTYRVRVRNRSFGESCTLWVHGLDGTLVGLADGPDPALDLPLDEGSYRVTVTPRTRGMPRYRLSVRSSP